MLSVDNIMFTILGYEMSYIEFIGTLFNIACVYLVAKNNIINWPIGIVGSVLFAILFFQIQLYSDLLEQIYFIVTGFVGWYLWSTRGKQEEKREVTWAGYYEWPLIILGTTMMTFGLAMMMGNIHNVINGIEPASYPGLDAATTAMSFVATVLLIYRRVEAWILWIIVDIIGIGLYYEKEVVFISLLYVAFLVLAVRGFFNWKALATNKV